MKHCPCGTGKRYLECCGLYLEKKLLPDTLEVLMRSRYTAFVEGKLDYIKKTMRPPALLRFDKQIAKKRQEKWQGLEVIRSFLDPDNINIGYVEFIAKFKLGNLDKYIHELSEFHYIERRWFYVDGKHFD